MLFEKHLLTETEEKKLKLKNNKIKRRGHSLDFNILSTANCYKTKDS